MKLPFEMANTVFPPEAFRYDKMARTQRDRIRLIHWDREEAILRTGELAKAGYIVDGTPFDGPPAFKRMKQDPPAAVVIDLSRIPSQGRDVAVGLRVASATRRVPIVFVEGNVQKVDRVRQLLPDAVYTSWSLIAPSLKQAIETPSREPIVPRSTMAGYAGVSLVKKLGVKKGTVLSLVDAPPGFEQLLGELPQGAITVRGLPEQPDLTLWFVRSRHDLQERIASTAARAGKGGLWIAWPKKSSDLISDLAQQAVRKAGLAAGLVDYKVCAIDKTWSGLRFARRRIKSTRTGS